MMLPGSELLAAHSAIVFAGPAIIFAGYLIFGISGFGASLITVPVLSYYLSLKTALPICVLLDFTSAMVLGTRLRGGVEKREILLLVPFSLIGAVTGATLLLHLPRQAALAALGCFAFTYGIYSLWRGAAVAHIGPWWSLPAGFVGGVMGALFGVGGPPYAIYLTGRLRDPSRFRATMSAMVVASVGMRAAVFAIIGLIVRDTLIAFALLFPFACFGLWGGQRLHGYIPNRRLLQFLGGLVALSGASLLYKALL